MAVPNKPQRGDFNWDVTLNAALDWLDERIDGVPAGDSAYEVALENGFEGTEQDWLDSLIGQDGADGTANTGDITFDGVGIIGAGTASGDGNEYGTIELVPDESRAEYDQYLIIDPTAPNHIHIRAGGEQDASSADLILGGERNNVYVSDNGRSVSISARPAQVISSYVNENPVSNGNFIVDNSANIYVGDEFSYPAGEEPGIFTVSSVAYNTPSAELMTVTATGLTFVSGGTYVFTHEEPWNYQWGFTDTGYLYGPAMGGLYVSGILNNESDLWLASNNNIVLSAEDGEFLGDPNNAENQIATLGNIGVETDFTVAGGTDGTQPTFTGDPLFTGSYVRMSNNLVFFQIQVDMDNITNFGTGQYYVTLPFPAKYESIFREGNIFDNSTSKLYHISGHVEAGSNEILLYTSVKDGGNVEDVPFTATSPVTLTTADNFHISGTYISPEVYITEAP